MVIKIITQGTEKGDQKSILSTHNMCYTLCIRDRYTAMEVSGIRDDVEISATVERIYII
jgi:hypothetical protein